METTLLQKYYDRDDVNKKDLVTKEESIVFGILEDLTDRKGLDNEWDDIDEGVQNDILQTWLEIVKTNLSM